MRPYIYASNTFDADSNPVHVSGTIVSDSDVDAINALKQRGIISPIGYAFIELTELKFGDVLLYTSPQNQDRKTQCVFIRDDNGRAVVLFQHAEWAARVSYEFLSKEDNHENDPNRQQV